MQIILGSQSPRRKEILSYFSLSYTQISSDFDEDSVVFQGDPLSYAHAISHGKAQTLSTQFPHAIILTADTIVYRQGKIYGKPQNDQEALRYLKELIGQWHSVYTSLTLRQREREWQAIEETRVLFNELTEEQICTYYQMIPYTDKAGGYAIQHAGSLIVKRIEGCYYNVMGLPVNALRELLLQVGIDLWKHLK